MTGVQFTTATKHAAKLRMALDGPAGSGKTYTALSVAAALPGPVALIDTEHGSASKYADLFDFAVLELESFHPERYTEAIAAAEAAAGTVGLVADRLDRNAVLCELKPDYADMGADRIVGDSPMFTEIVA